MKEIFDTKNSLKKFKLIMPLCGAICFSLSGIIVWFRCGSVTITDFLAPAIAGFCFGWALFFIQWIRYRNIFFEITDEYVSKKNGPITIRSVSVRNVEYYFFSDREKFPKIKVYNEKDFDFEMTLGAETAIVAALEKIGINKKV